MNPVKEKLLIFLLVFYIVSTLIGMAPMSIGSALFTIFFIALDPTQAWSSLKRSCENSKIKRYALWTALLIVACILSLITAKLFPLSYNGKHAIVEAGFLGKLWYFIVPVLIATTFFVRREKTYWTVIKIWLIGFALFSAIGPFQYFTGWPRPQIIPFTDPVRYHATLFLGHHLSVASIYIFPFFLTLGLLLDPNGPKKIGLPRSVLGAIATIGLVTLFLGYSRMLWIALPIGLFSLFVLYFLSRKQLFLPIAMLLAIAVGGAVLIQTDQVQRRIHTTHGTDQRYDLWEANLDFIKNRPLTGVGWRANQELSGYYLMKKYPNREHVFSGHAHNMILDMAAGTGLIGLLTWLAWCIFAITLAWNLFRQIETSHIGMSLIAAWITFHLNGLTQVNFWESKVLHQVLLITGLSLYMVIKNKERDQHAAT